MNLHTSVKSLALAAALACVVVPMAARADADAPCATGLRNALKIAGAAPDVCETSARLVPGKNVVLALWNTDPDSPAEIPLAAVLDRDALEHGRKIFLFKRRAMGESIEPFLFEGRKVDVAIADFEGRGRVGWGMWLVPDADYFFAITVYDPKTNSFVEIAPSNAGGFTADDLDAMVQVSKGQILIPVCGGPGATPAQPGPELHFDVYRVKNGVYEQGDRVLATSASPAEREKCRKSGM
jgi:hypothetical protein